jgi:hypothetical protein
MKQDKIYALVLANPNARRQFDFRNKTSKVGFLDFLDIDQLKVKNQWRFVDNSKASLYMAANGDDKLNYTEVLNGKDIVGIKLI